MLNLFIAVVLEGFSSTNKEHTGVVTSEHFNELLDAWMFFDNSGDGWICVTDVVFLVYELNDPLGRNSEFESEIQEIVNDGNNNNQGKEKESR